MQVGQLAYRRALRETALEIRAIGFGLLYCHELRRIADRRVIGERSFCQPIGTRAVFGEYRVGERRPGGFCRDDGFHQLGPRIADHPADGARLRVRHYNGRTDPVEQCRACIAIELLDGGVDADVLHLRGVELIEHRIASCALVRSLAGPLRVQLRLRPQRVLRRRRKSLLKLRRRKARERSHRFQPGRASACGLIDYIHRITALDKKFRPAFAAVGRTGEIGAGLRCTVNHHDGVALRYLGREAVFDIHLPFHHGARLGIDVAATDEEIAL